MKISRIALATTLALMPLVTMAGTVTDARVERVAPDRLRITWTDSDSVDVYTTDRADKAVSAATLISGNDGDNVHEQTVTPGARPYFLLRDRKGGQPVRVAERLVPLEHGSNFRDIGGYPAANGKHVRWGLIYRSGATPLLTDADVKTVSNLNLSNVVDLRSSEERQLAPSRIEHVRYSAVGYSMNDILTAMRPGVGATVIPSNGGALYTKMPAMLAPQMQVLFDRLLERSGPVAFNCSAGQDRTGFATALILSALGVPRDVIIADYHLSTTYRRPEYEMPKFDPAAFPDNAAAKMFSHYRSDPSAAKPQPLKEADGTAFLSFALNEIDQRYGSVASYLDKELKVSSVHVATLRATYLE